MIRVRHPYNGIQLDIRSDQNGVQFYTSNFLNLTTKYSKYSIHGGFCLETHNYPDSVNKVKIFLEFFFNVLIKKQKNLFF